MVKFLSVVCIILVLAGVGGYFYFIQKINVQADLLAQKEQQLAEAREQAQQVQADLAVVMKDEKTRKVLSEELLACQQGRFEQEYLNWPAFLRPNEKGEIEPIRRWVLSKVADLTSLSIVSYSPPELMSSDGLWHFDVRFFGQRLSGEYGVNIVHFRFDQGGRSYKATEEAEW